VAGHNKWSKIKHRKAVVDKRRSKAWTMCSRAIISAARQGGPDAMYNFALRAALDEARYHNVPNDNIDRAIRKGTGGGESDNFEPVRYEGYGPGGAAVIIDALTDNRTRTAGNIRLIFSDHEARLGTSGAVAHQFEQKGRLTLAAGEHDEDRVMAAAIEAGADDARPFDEHAWEIFTAPTDLASVRSGLEAAGFKIGESGFEMLPLVAAPVCGPAVKDLLAFIDALEDDEDVKKVFTNAEWPASELAED